MAMKRLKLAQTAWANYTGQLGIALFKDGVSIDPLPDNVRNRMAASMQFIEIDEDGSEQPAGAAHRLVSEKFFRAEVKEPLKRQTAEEKAAESAQAVIAADKAPALETRESLEKIAEKGIKALREVAKKWNVKHRSIPTLIEMILDAQERFMAARNKKLEAKVEAAAEAAAGTTLKVDAPVDQAAADLAAALEAAEDPDTIHEDEKADDSADEGPVDETDPDAALKAAAASGDLAAALKTEE